MSRVIGLSDERYHVAEQLAAEHGQSPEELIASLPDAAWERACAPYDAAFRADASWLEGAREALAEADAGQVTAFPSTEAFLRHLGATEEELDEARRREGDVPVEDQ